MLGRTIEEEKVLATDGTQIRKKSASICVLSVANKKLCLHAGERTARLDKPAVAHNQGGDHGL
jgi:hypothetical protein